MGPSSLLFGVAVWHQVFLSHSSELETCGPEGVAATEGDTVSLLQDVKKVQTHHAIQSVNPCDKTCKKKCKKTCKQPSRTAKRACRKGCNRCANFNCGGTSPSPSPLSSPSPSPAGPMTLKLLPDTTKCLDGTPAGYYLNTKEDSDVWVIWMKGGGSCKNATECAGRVNGPLGSSKRWKSTLYATGVLQNDCSKNPDFCTANQVYINYCSGDSHKGTRTEKHEGYFMSGHLNFKSIILDLLLTTSLSTASRVLLTGSSAGGSGVMGNADALKYWLQAQKSSMIVKASPIAGLFPDPEDGCPMVSLFEDFPEVSDPVPVLDSFRTKLEWSQENPANCPKSEGVMCASMATFCTYVETPLFIANNMWDSFQLKNVYRFPQTPSQWSDTQKDWATYYAKAMQKSAIKLGEMPGNGLFLPPTVGHGGDCGSGGKSAEIKGLDYFKVLADWFYDQDKLPHVLTEACDTVDTCMGLL